MMWVMGRIARGGIDQDAWKTTIKILTLIPPFPKSLCYGTTVIGFDVNSYSPRLSPSWK